MTSVASVSIDLTLNRSQFDNDLQKIEQENLGAIALSTRLDPTNFKRQIEGLTGFLPTVSIPVELDATRFQQQLSQLGKESVSIALKCDRTSFDRLRIPVLWVYVRKAIA